MRRRDFVKIIAGSAMAWPVAARAQQRERVRRVGVLMNLAADDPVSLAYMNALAQGLHQFGWIDGLNLHVDTRWAGSDPERFRKYAEELVELTPDVLLASTSSSVVALQQASRRTAPIVFVNVTDPVGQGFVASLARPGGDVTGFAADEFEIAQKWLELLKEISPTVRRVAVLRDVALVANGGMLETIQGAASSFALEVTPLGVLDSDAIERDISAFAARPNGGLIVLASPRSVVHRKQIIAQAAKHNLAAIYALRFFAADGGLVSYGPDALDLYRRAASYVDRILKGEKPADLPVQAPTKYQLVINLKSAEALGLKVPSSLLATADEVIE
jgi:putative ABC transport system substrate-binding protein